MIQDHHVLGPRYSTILLVLCVLVTAGGSAAPGQKNEPTTQNTGQPQLIEKIVYDSIAWALTKDRARLESIIAHDDDYFSFHPDGLDGVHGYAEFEQGFDLWMDPRFEATTTEVRQFRCHLSRSGNVAWFSAILDDCFTWDGRPGCWKDTRWTGVLEKREGKWLIVQMHFSFAADRNNNSPSEDETME